MKIYTLVVIDTKKSFSPIAATSFPTREKAHNAMVDDVKKTLSMCGWNEQDMKGVENPLGYGCDGVCVGYDYASVGSLNYWDIIVTEISAKDTLISLFVEEMHKQYVLPKRVDETIYRLVNEYTEENFMAIADFNEFKNDCFIGEALYENAIAQLGGKTDEQSYQTIANYLDTNFVANEMANPLCFDCYDIQDDVQKMDSHNKWMLGMLLLAGGDEKIIHDVRLSINNEDDEIFAVELASELHKDMLCPDHRAKSSKLNDNEYGRFVNQICDGDAIDAMIKGNNPKTYAGRTRNNWVALYKRLMEIFRQDGFDSIEKMNDFYSHLYYFDKSLDCPIVIDADDYAFSEFLDKYDEKEKSKA